MTMRFEPAACPHGRTYNATGMLVCLDCHSVSMPGGPWRSPGSSEPMWPTTVVSDSGRLARYEKALREIADWDGHAGSDWTAVLQRKAREALRV